MKFIGIVLFTFLSILMSYSLSEKNQCNNLFTISMTRLDLSEIRNGTIRGNACYIQIPKFPPTELFYFLDNPELIDIDGSWFNQYLPVSINIESDIYNNSASYVQARFQIRTNYDVLLTVDYQPL